MRIIYYIYINLTYLLVQLQIDMSLQSLRRAVRRFTKHQMRKLRSNSALRYRDVVLRK